MAEDVNVADLFGIQRLENFRPQLPWKVFQHSEVVLDAVVALPHQLIVAFNTRNKLWGDGRALGKVLHRFQLQPERGTPLIPLGNERGDRTEERDVHRHASSHHSRADEDLERAVGVVTVAASNALESPE